MRIDELKLKNFCRYANYSMKFQPGFSLIVGKNGSGKTTLLNALSVAMGSWLLGLSRYSKDCKAPSIDREDARLRCLISEKTKTVRYEYQYPVEITALGEVEGRQLRWTRSLESAQGRTTTGGASGLKQLGERMGRLVMLGKEEVKLPLISYYGAGRLWLQPRDMKAKRASANTKASKSSFRGYLNSHDPRSDAAAMFRWFQTQQYIQLEEGKAPVELLAVRKAVLSCIEGGKRLYFSVRLADLILEIEGQERQPFNNLSDGYKNMIAIVGDIAWKAIQLNPHLGVKAISETRGVVLIDELDLHLHPHWQRRVIDDLRRTFPMIQFICTTHSPFLIQAARPGEVISLDKEVAPEDYVGASIEDIVESVQGVEDPQQSAAAKHLGDATERYLELLRENGKSDKTGLAAAERELREAQQLFTSEPGLNALLKLEAMAAEEAAKKP